MSQKEDITLLQIRSSEQGFSIISAIFLLVVIAALGAFSVSLTTTQQQSTALDMLGGRAYQAARAGVEWGAFQITQSGVVGVGNAFATQCQNNGSTLLATASQPPALPATLLSTFSVEVRCGATSFVDNVDGVTLTRVYELASTASGVNGATPGSPDYVERKMRVTIAQ